MPICWGSYSVPPSLQSRLCDWKDIHRRDSSAAEYMSLLLNRRPSRRYALWLLHMTYTEVFLPLQTILCSTRSRIRWRDWQHAIAGRKLHGRLRIWSCASLYLEYLLDAIAPPHMIISVLSSLDLPTPLELLGMTAATDKVSSASRGGVLSKLSIASHDSSSLICETPWPFYRSFDLTSCPVVDVLLRQSTGCSSMLLSIADGVGVAPKPRYWYAVTNLAHTGSCTLSSILCTTGSISDSWLGSLNTAATSFLLLASA